MSFLKFLWKKWLPVAQAIGNFQAQVTLTFFYLLVLWPVGIFFRVMADPLNLKGVKRSNFAKWEHPKETLETARKQY